MLNPTIMLFHRNCILIYLLLENLKQLVDLNKFCRLLKMVFILSVGWRLDIALRASRTCRRSFRTSSVVAAEVKRLGVVGAGQMVRVMDQSYIWL